MKEDYATYLLNRNGIYYFHYRIPKSLKHCYGSKTFIRVSLKTTCKSEALKKSKILWVSIMSDKKVSNEEIDRKIIRLEDLYERGKVLSKAFHETDGHSAYQEDDVLSRFGREGYTLDFDKEAIEYFDGRYLWKDGRVYERGRKQVLSKEVSSIKEMSFSELTQKFIEEKELGKAWSVRTSKENRNLISTIVELCGDVVCSELTEDFISEKFSKNLSKIPVHSSKKPAYLDSDNRRKNIHECIRICEKRSLDSIKYRTQSKYVTLFRSILQWGENRNIIAKEALLALDFFKTIKKKTSRKEENYSLRELETLFYHEDFVRGKYHYKYPERHWGQLLALYTGARANEIAQILIKEICTDGDIYYIDLNDEDNEKRLKTENSKRIVPIHDDLIKLGFIEYYDYQSKCSEKLFPRCVADKTGENYHRKLTGWYMTEHLQSLKEEGLIKEHMKFHSFRHTFIDKTNQLQLNEKVINEIVGHGLGRTKTQQTYRNDFLLKTKSEEINKISFGLELSKIKVWEKKTR